MIDLGKLEAWCQDAVSLLPTPDLPPSFTEMRRDTIRRHSGTSELHEIASDLAEGLSHLPERARAFAQEQLTERHGFGFEVYTDKKMRVLRGIMKRGAIRSSKEYEALLNLASDTTLGVVARDTVSNLLACYELAVEKQKASNKHEK